MILYGNCQNWYKLQFGVDTIDPIPPNQKRVFKVTLLFKISFHDLRGKLKEDKTKLYPKYSFVKIS